MPSLDPELYTVAWIAPLEIEARAALCVFDKVHDGDFPTARGHDYVFTAGEVCGHNVVLATLPPGQPYGTGSAGALAGQVKMAFPNLWFGLLVGVAAGLPDLARSRDIRLGDVLVALPEGESAGLIAYDLGKQVGENTVQLLHGGQVLAKTETVVRSAIGKLKLKAPRDTAFFLPYYERIRDQEHATGTFVDPGQDKDVFYASGTAVDRPARPVRTRVWYGPIGSGEKLMRDAARRDELRDQYGIIGLEMEAAGTMNTIPVGVVRGVCDYADGLKNTVWQPYAAAMAAAYATAILNTIQPKKGKGKARYFLVPFDRNENFVGRASILDTLLQRIPPCKWKDGCQRTVIEGLGGIGKTQVALEVAYRVRDEYPDCSIFWVPAVDVISFEKTYRDIGLKLGVPGIEKADADIKALMKAAFNDEKNGHWLLIIDNADDPAILFEGIALYSFLPSNQQGSILFTTRNRTVAAKSNARGHIITLEEMDQGEATTLLHQELRTTQIGDPNDTTQLLELLAHLPLAIKQASAYLLKTMSSISKYLTLCESSDQILVKLLSKEFNDPDRYDGVPNAVATTWLISFGQITENNPLAARYLKFICFLAEKDIPISLLPPMKDEEETVAAIGVLKGYAFIIERHQPDAFDMHRLVRLATRNWVKQDWTVCCTDVIRHLSTTYPVPKHENRKVWIRYMPHAQAALEVRNDCTNKKAKAYFLFKVAATYERLGKFGETKQMYRQTLALMKEVLGRDHPDTLGSMMNLANVLNKQGKYGEAEQMHRKTLELKKELLGRDHPDTLDSMLNLANVLHNQGKYGEAEQIHRQTLELMKKVLGRDHPNTLGSMMSLANVLFFQRKYGEVEQMYRQTLELRKEVLGRDHHDTLNNMMNLANVLYYQGKYGEAEQIQRQTLELKKEVLGQDHPDTLDSMMNLAIVISYQGKYGEAEQMHRQTLELRKEVLGRNHHDTLNNMMNLANVLAFQGKYGEAEKIQRQTLELMKEVLGRDHPNTLGSMMSLANVFFFQGKYGEVEQMYRQTLELRKEVLGRDHHDKLGNMMNLANVLLFQGKYGEAEQIHRQTLELKKEVLGRDHPDTLDSMTNLAIIFSRRGKHAEAEQMHRQTLELKEEVLGRDHPDTLDSIDALALANAGQGRHEESEKLQK